MKCIVSDGIEFVDGLSVEGLLTNVFSIGMRSIGVVMKVLDHAFSFMDSFAIEGEEWTMFGEALMRVEFVDDIIELCLSDSYFLLLQKVFDLADTSRALLTKVADDCIFGWVKEKHVSFF